MNITDKLTELGFNIGTEAGVDNLFKALATSNLLGSDSSATGAAPLKLEDLDPILRSITDRTELQVFYNLTQKQRANSNIVQYALKTKLSDASKWGGFASEGNLGENNQSTYGRLNQIVKMICEVGGVTLEAMAVNNVVNVQTDEIENRMVNALSTTSFNLYNGDANCRPLAFNGIASQHRHSTGINGYATFSNYFLSQNAIVIDMHGYKLTPDKVTEAMSKIRKNKGWANTLITSPDVIADWNNYILPNSRYIFNNGDGKINTGTDVMKHVTPWGSVALQSDIHASKLDAKLLSDNADSTKAPSAVTGGSATPVGSDTYSNWLTADAGDYYYAVSAINGYGESALHCVNAGGKASISAGGSVDLIFTDGGGSYPATSYMIYRSAEGAADTTGEFYPLFEVAVQEKVNGFDGAAPTYIRDRNRFMPDCEQAFVYGNTPDYWVIKELLPLMKLDLALRAPIREFMILYFLSPVLYKPSQIARIINIGTKTVTP